MNILAVDSDVNFLKSIANELADSNHNVIFSPNYTDAMYYFNASNPDVVLVDYLLKGDSRTGIDLAIEMKNLNPSIKCILLSGLLVREEYKDQSLFLRVFKKPVTVKKVVNYILSLSNIRSSKAD